MYTYAVTLILYIYIYICTYIHKLTYIIHTYIISTEFQNWRDVHSPKFALIHMHTQTYTLTHIHIITNKIILVFDPTYIIVIFLGFHDSMLLCMLPFHSHVENAQFAASTGQAELARLYSKQPNLIPVDEFTQVFNNIRTYIHIYCTYIYYTNQYPN